MPSFSALPSRLWPNTDIRDCFFLGSRGCLATQVLRMVSSCQLIERKTTNGCSACMQQFFDNGGGVMRLRDEQETRSSISAHQRRSDGRGISGVDEA
jgi:hypothetical protein